ncbi:tRNA 5-methoxyuridine(34)/uridine 5-oxyacetic acid(34) synthase CmoB [Halovibrio salipaludis]|uniref:tRNA U34 carboxymethyltransferase n=1 Tax=Halovibrio salipaludis TaxID=2032626 RepID=A0A2A2F001_9GAMM|nr:tRNA 5-methoxyuridine(34)/uridine 5-oxyacetic acid(34) synthase CmoB [Halovibrio salipaludis]PAU78756.1 tRNA 5-methoxyuridine(34)/uridine 5-oxyacetic acid(34) synthase CmoB [Halovibrio salipaludis]
MSTDFDWRSEYANLLDWLRDSGRTQWHDQLEQRLSSVFETHPHGDLPRWLAALNQLPRIPGPEADLDQPTVTLRSPGALSHEQQDQLEQGLRGLMPWRKGPFDFFGTHIDTEWRSDWKWDRVRPSLSDLRNRNVLDVGCGSGYHCWRVLGAGARRVVGIDPGMLFLIQFQAVRGYLDDPPAHLLPQRLEDLPHQLQLFDTTLSLGVLYHRRSPIDHLIELKGTLKPGGELVLETLVIEGEMGETLMPEDRYARMRNVWFIPSVPTLERWLQRAGYRDIQCVDVTRTTTDEQRSTSWMQFQSLPDFLDPEDGHRTIEGYPAPRRATLVARKPA